MKYYIFRNHTVERLFDHLQPVYGSYGDIFDYDKEAETYIWFFHPPLKNNIVELVKEINDYVEKLKILTAQISPRSTLLVFLLDDWFAFQYSNTDDRLRDAIQSYSQYVRNTAEKNAHIKTIDLGEFTRLYAFSDLVDWKYYYISQTIFNPKISKDFSRWFNTQLNAIKMKRKKCLVLDLDNTLWGGILGEDGVNGIQIGNDYPGSAFKDFQESILIAGQNGVILAVCSKNNEDDVQEAWSENPNILIKQEHLSAYRINWNSKAENMQEIAEELNIGLDSFVFLDDNPAEREIIKQMLPEVAVPDFPEKPYLLVPFFRQVYQDFFQAYSLTKEDLTKTQQYLQNTQRNIQKSIFGNIDEYLASLEMELDVQTLSEKNLNRIAQLTQKTNQFNLTTKRYETSHIESFSADGARVHCLSVKDKFGDNGITVVSIIKIDGELGEVDTYLLSCRILGRGIEFVYLKYLLNQLYKQGIRTIRASYIPSAKNRQVNDYYDKIGFVLQEEKSDGSRHYILKMEELFEIKSYYRIIES